MPIDEHDRRILRSWSAHVSGKISIVLETTRDSRSAALHRFAEELTVLAPHIAVIPVVRDTGDLPGFFIGHGWIWHAVPSGAELRPFLETAALYGDVSTAEPKTQKARENISSPQIPPQLQSYLHQLQTPKELEIFTAAQCPHCGHMLLELAPIPFQSPYLVLRVVDAILFEEKARAAGVRSVPTVLFGRNFRWTGRTDLTHIFEVVCREESTGLSAAAAIRLLKEGKAHEVTQLMLSSPTAWNDFPLVLTHPEWSVRLGALVVLEELAEKDPAKAAAYLPSLWEKMETFSPAVQGDLLYATGLVGDVRWKDSVARWILKNAKDPELREVGEETLKRLESKSPP